MQSFSPRERGCSSPQPLRDHRTHSFPRASGDVPGCPGWSFEWWEFSPRERGCSHEFAGLFVALTVFPARAGMFRVRPAIFTSRWSFPRASGDVPQVTTNTDQPGTFSPRERGCSRVPVSDEQTHLVFPARAGMFRFDGLKRLTALRFPRASGDVPCDSAVWKTIRRFSPRERGCSSPVAGLTPMPCVFPARAGMFPGSWQRTLLRPGFPRASGNVPHTDPGKGFPHEFSPRERGCSLIRPARTNTLNVFPARAGMFRRYPGQKLCRGGFPRASGDVPTGHEGHEAQRRFSPRERGCSCGDLVHEELPLVFPARAGMFPRIHVVRVTAGCFPRASGDVPLSRQRTSSVGQFSPRERGCS